MTPKELTIYLNEKLTPHLLKSATVSAVVLGDQPEQYIQCLTGQYTVNDLQASLEAAAADLIEQITSEQVTLRIWLNATYFNYEWQQPATLYLTAFTTTKETENN